MVKVELLLEVIEALRSLTNRLQAVVDEETSEEKVPVLEEVRAALAEKANAGYVAGVKKLVAAHGAGRLSEVEPAEYPALLAEVREL